MKYKFKYKRLGSWFWQTHAVIGHQYDKAADRMMIYYPNGSFKEIAEWTKCELILGTDWVLALKTFQEKQIGQPINLAVEKE